MSEKEYSAAQANDQNREMMIAERIRICSAETALHIALLERFYNHHFYYIHAGFLLPHRIILSKGEACYGGLNEEKTLFLLVPVELVRQRKRDCLLRIARERLGTDDHDSLAAYCEQVEREISTGTAQHPHPAFQAETQACEVAFWLSMPKQQHVPLSADWSWEGKKGDHL